MRAKFSYAAAADDELSFKKGDQIEVLNKTGDWWTGRLRGREGIFPVNFVKQMSKGAPMRGSQRGRGGSGRGGAAGRGRGYTVVRAGNL